MSLAPAPAPPSSSSSSSSFPFPLSSLFSPSPSDSSSLALPSARSLLVQYLLSQLHSSASAAAASSRSSSAAVLLSASSAPAPSSVLDLFSVPSAPDLSVVSKHLSSPLFSSLEVELNDLEHIYNHPNNTKKRKRNCQKSASDSESDSASDDDVDSDSSSSILSCSDASPANQRPRLNPSDSHSHSHTGASATAELCNEVDSESSLDSGSPLVTISLNDPLSCGLCGLFLYRPLTAACGHSFCQFCLISAVDSAAAACKSCPVAGCGSSLECTLAAAQLSPAPGCIALRSALERCFPLETSAARLHTEAVQAVAAGDDDRAISLLSGALSTYPNSFHLYASRLTCYLRTCDFDGALSDVAICADLTSEAPLPVPRHQRSWTLDTLAALGHAGLITRIYQLAIHSFASVLRLSEPGDAAVDRQKIAHKLMDAYLCQLQESDRQHNGDALSPPVSAFLSAPTGAASSLPSSRPLLDQPASSLINSELQCALCMDLLFEPVSTRCGHTFCRLCLTRSLDHRNQCPNCREPLSQDISPTRQPVNAVLDRILRVWCPERSAARAQQIAAELSELSNLLPIFVCTLMFPGVSCPLHIFEPQYKLLIRNCLESGTNRFGMVLPVDSCGGYSSIGCTAEIRSVKMLQDGRSLIEAVGGRRFRIKERGNRNGYEVATVEWIEDLSEEEQQNLYGQAQPALSALVTACQELVFDCLFTRMPDQFDIETQLGAMPPAEPERLLDLASWICAVLPLPMQDKYQFLQLRSHYQRFAFLHQTLTKLQAETESFSF